nr:DUF6438 domain-containing protein [Lewinella sp. JB7]
MYRERQRGKTDNETARIENQANVGTAPLAPADDDAARKEAPLFSFSKSACYGDCDVYTLEVRPDGNMLLNVSNGLMGKGAYERQLDDFAKRDLLTVVDSLRNTVFEPLYPVDDEVPTDLQFTRLVLPDADGRPRSVTVYYGAPHALNRFIERLETLVDAEIWRSLPPPRR